MQSWNKLKKQSNDAHSDSAHTDLRKKQNNDKPCTVRMCSRRLDYRYCETVHIPNKKNVDENIDDRNNPGTKWKFALVKTEQEGTPCSAKEEPANKPHSGRLNETLQPVGRSRWMKHSNWLNKNLKIRILNLNFMYDHPYFLRKYLLFKA